MEALYYKDRKVVQAAGKANGGLTDAPHFQRKGQRYAKRELQESARTRAPRSSSGGGEGQ
jgi:hypothetical protein